jgi:L-lysine exporter family protein LysE/ArgO
MSPSSTALLAMMAGFGLGLSLIVAIGAQNAFVLRQGIRAKHALLIVAICAISDLVLILLGISGVGVVVQNVPVALVVIRWVGAAFLVCYGLLAARRGFTGGRLETDRGGEGPSLRTAVLTVLGISLVVQS